MLINQIFPDISSEKYCGISDYYDNCFSDDYETIDLDLLKDHVAIGTKKVEVSLVPGFNGSIDLSLVPGKINYSFFRCLPKDAPNLSLVLDVSSQGNIAALSINGISLKSTFKNNTGEKVNFDVPYLSIANTKLGGEWLEKTFDFNNSIVAIDISNYEELSGSRYRDIILRPNSSITSFSIGKSGWNANVGKENINFQKSLITGNLGLEFDAERFIDDPKDIVIDVDPSLKSIDGLYIFSYSNASTQSRSMSLNFTDNWNNIENVGTGVNIKNLCALKLKGVSEKLGLSLEGNGEFIIDLKNPNKVFKFEKPTKINGSTDFIINNGDAAFSQLTIERESEITFEAIRSNVSTNKVVADTMVLEENVTVLIENLTVHNQVIMNPRSILLSDDINVSSNEIIYNYLLDGFPNITSHGNLTAPSKVVFNYASDEISILMGTNLTGNAFDVLCDLGGSFTEDQCNQLAQTAVFNSSFVDLNGNTSVLKPFCSVIRKYVGYKMCLIVNITSMPSTLRKSEEENNGNDNKQEKSNDNVGTIVGCTIAAIVLVVVVVYGTLIYRKKKSHANKMSSSD